MRIPIRIRQLPAFAASCLHRMIAAVTRKPRSARFKLCYFSCRAHFQYLYCSLHSLSRLKRARRFQILVLCDRDDYLLPSQIADIEALGLPTQIIAWGRMTGWGAEHTVSVWDGFRYAVEADPRCDFVAKVDSDVFFFSDWIFDLAAFTNADLFGDGHYDCFQFVQGGLYIFKAAAIPRILNRIPTSEFARHFEKANLLSEDRAAYYLAKQTGQRIAMRFFMMSPTEYANAGRLSWYQRKKFGCLHYVGKNKAPMLDVYQKELIPIGDREDFRAVVGDLSE